MAVDSAAKFDSLFADCYNLQDSPRGVEVMELSESLGHSFWTDICPFIWKSSFGSPRSEVQSKQAIAQKK
jgi:hypothetical protein